MSWNRFLLPVSILAAASLATGCSGGGGGDDDDDDGPTEFSLALSASAIELTTGGADVTVDVVVTRTGTVTPVEVTLVGSAGVLADPLTVAAEQAQGTLVLSAPLSATQVESLAGTVNGEGGDFQASAPLTMRVRGAPGTFDTTFGGGGIVLDLGATDRPFSVAVQQDGKTIIGGDSDFDSAIVRLLPNGQLDSTFATGGVGSFHIGQGYSWASAIKILADGKILAGGYSSTSAEGNDNEFMLFRLTPDGELDGGFGTGGSGVVRLDVATANGAFNVDDDVRSIDIDSTGRIVAGGRILTSPNAGALARFSATGVPDTAFDTNGSVRDNTFRSIDDVAVSGTSIIALGALVGAYGIARYNDDGSRDMTFNTTGLVVGSHGRATYATAMDLQSDGKILVTGSLTNPSDVFVARYNADGSPDLTFATQGVQVQSFTTFIEEAWGVASAPDGSVFFGGTAFPAPSDGDLFAAHLLADGTVDTNFAPAGFVTAPDTTNDACRAFSLAGTDRLVVAGWASGNPMGEDIVVVRLWR